jgi:hypothetical protein
MEYVSTEEKLKILSITNSAWIKYYKWLDIYQAKKDQILINKIIKLQS